MVSDSNKSVFIRSEGRGSIVKQLVLRTASTHQLLVKVPSWLHWLAKWWGCRATTRCSVIVGIRAGLRLSWPQGIFEVWPELMKKVNKKKLY